MEEMLIEMKNNSFDKKRLKQLQMVQDREYLGKYFSIAYEKALFWKKDLSRTIARQQESSNTVKNLHRSKQRFQANNKQLKQKQEEHKWSAITGAHIMHEIMIRHGEDESIQKLLLSYFEKNPKKYFNPKTKTSTTR
jgi:hypothetical protein